MVNSYDEATEHEYSYPQSLDEWNAYGNSQGSSSVASSFPLQYSLEIDQPVNWYPMPAPPAPPAESTRATSARVAKLLGEALSAHDEVSAKRQRIREIRHMLRQKRGEEGDVRLAVQRKLNLITAENAHEDLVSINQTINALQAATASYFILENEYHRQEDELSQQEYYYTTCLEKLQTIFKKQSASLTQAHGHGINSDTDSSSADYTSDNGDQIPHAVAEYLSVVGEARMLTEHLSELEAEYSILVNQSGLRERTGIPLDSGSVNFLLRYQAEKTKIESELELTRSRLASHPEHARYSARIDAEEDAEEDEMIQHFLPEEPRDQQDEDPLRSSEFEDRSPFFESACPLPVNKATFVNRWLLHRLRHSKVEILRFKSSPELVDLGNQGWESESISKMAMMLWFEDDERMDHVERLPVE
jgi:hypothetical protein